MGKKSGMNGWAIAGCVEGVAPVGVSARAPLTPIVPAKARASDSSPEDIEETRVF
jgi:hypothetical protein